MTPEDYAARAVGSVSWCARPPHLGISAAHKISFLDALVGAATFLYNATGFFGTELRCGKYAAWFLMNFPDFEPDELLKNDINFELLFTRVTLLGRIISGIGRYDVKYHCNVDSNKILMANPETAKVVLIHLDELDQWFSKPPQRP